MNIPQDKINNIIVYKILLTITTTIPITQQEINDLKEYLERHMDFDNLQLDITSI